MDMARRWCLGVRVTEGEAGSDGGKPKMLRASGSPRLILAGKLRPVPFKEAAA